MDIVVDIQFFKNNKREYVPKEIAVVSINKNFSAHWVLQSTIPLNAMVKCTRRENDWLTRNHHGLNYFDGEASFELVKKCLRDLVKEVNKIYVRGAIKSETLNKIIAHQIHNLENNEHCPSFDNLFSDLYCMHHAAKNKYYFCALNNAYKLKSWLSTKSFIQEKGERERLPKICNG